MEQPWTCVSITVGLALGRQAGFAVPTYELTFQIYNLYMSLYTKLGSYEGSCQKMRSYLLEIFQ